MQPEAQFKGFLQVVIGRLWRLWFGSSDEERTAERLCRSLEEYLSGFSRRIRRTAFGDIWEMPGDYSNSITLCTSGICSFPFRDERGAKRSLAQELMISCVPVGATGQASGLLDFIGEAMVQKGRQVYDGLEIRLPQSVWVSSVICVECDPLALDGGSIHYFDLRHYCDESE